MRTAKALTRLHRCAGSPEPSLVVCVISTIISCAGSLYLVLKENSFRAPYSKGKDFVYRLLAWMYYFLALEHHFIGCMKCNAPVVFIGINKVGVNSFSLEKSLVLLCTI